MRNLFLLFLLGCNSDDGLKLYNSEPSISIQSHGIGVEIQSAQIVSFWALAADPNHSPENLLCSWYAYDSASNEIASCDWAAPDSEGMSYCDMSLTSETTRIVANVKDPLDAAAADEITVVMIEDSNPSVEILEPIEQGVYESDTLISFSAQVADQEDAASDLQIVWTSSIDGDLAICPDPGGGGNSGSLASGPFGDAGGRCRKTCTDEGDCIKAGLD